VAGALPEAEIVGLSEHAGFRDGRIVRRFNSFDGTAAARKVSPRMNLHAMNFLAVAR
jgi:hypothetical protein